MSIPEDRRQGHNAYPLMFGGGGGVEPVALLWLCHVCCGILPVLCQRSNYQVFFGGWRSGSHELSPVVMVLG